jgi:hypothetical protein
MNHESIVCSSCGALINSGDEYCPTCSAPTAFAFNLDPMKMIESEGHLFVRAVEGRQKPIVLIGVWILFLPMFLFGAFFAITIIAQGFGSGLENFVFFWGAFGLAFIAFIILNRVTSNYFRPKSPAADEPGDSLS